MVQKFPSHESVRTPPADVLPLPNPPQRYPNVYSTSAFAGLKLAIFDHFSEVLVTYKRHTPYILVFFLSRFVLISMGGGSKIRQEKGRNPPIGGKKYTLYPQENRQTDGWTLLDILSSCNTLDSRWSLDFQLSSQPQAFLSQSVYLHGGLLCITFCLSVNPSTAEPKFRLNEMKTK